MSADIGQDLAPRILKVDHAGEHGAVHIYAGQIFVARLTAPSLVDELREFKSHEECHREIFRAELERRGRPRCRSYHLCAIGGFVLGAISALLGRRAIAATTVTVESVVLVHLEQQLEQLRGRDAEACAAIEAIVDDERDHHDRSALHLQRRERAGNVWPRLLTPLVAASTETVIWLGMRL